jgi:hypothetical protein
MNISEAHACDKFASKIAKHKTEQKLQKVLNVNNLKVLQWINQELTGVIRKKELKNVKVIHLAFEFCKMK